MKNLFSLIFLATFIATFSTNFQVFSENYKIAEFSEIDLKNPKSDSIKISINPPLTSEIEIFDDKLITKISPSQISNEKFITIFFKADEEKTESTGTTLNIYTTKSGLTGTTEALTIRENKEVIDTVCWQNSSPTQTEKTHIEELTQSEKWQGQCVNSDEIKKSEKIIKKGTENKKESWKILKTESSTKTKKQNYQNGDLSNQIFINEILPNPKGEDANKEWIELYNASDKNINLGNWGIQNNKSFKIPNTATIKAKSYLILEKENLKITIRNTNEEIKLTDYLGNTIDKISYDKSQEDKSFSKIKIKSSADTTTKMEWTIPTKNSENQIFYKLEGIISKELTPQGYINFEITDDLNKKIKILVFPNANEIEILKNLLKKDTKIEILAEKINENYVLKEYQLKNNTTKMTQSKKTQKWEYFLLIPIAVGTIYLLYYCAKRPFFTITL